MKTIFKESSFKNASEQQLAIQDMRFNEYIDKYMENYDWILKNKIDAFMDLEESTIPPRWIGFRSYPLR